MIFDFSHHHEVSPKDLKALLGGKGANLAEMTSVLHLPVPPGFTITTEGCRAYLAHGWPDGLDEELAAAVSRLEAAMGRQLGDPVDPLLVSVRSGAQSSMPGMMDTVLNLGLNDRSVEGLASQTGDRRFALDSYRRFISMFARIVLDLEAEPFEDRLSEARAVEGVTSDYLVSPTRLEAVVADYLALVDKATGRPFPQDPTEQLRRAVEAVFSSWMGARAMAYREREHIPHDLGTAVNVQAMVFGNRDDRSGTGVGFTRDPATGENVPFGDFLVNAQGEDVVAGIRNTESLADLGRRFPQIHDELMANFRRLEVHYRDMCDVEFTIESDRLWMLQTRVGKRTGAAALRMAVEMCSDPDIALTHEEAVGRVTSAHLAQVFHSRFADVHHVALTVGLGASPGAAIGRCYFSADDAVSAVARGEDVILVRPETSPEDVHGMMAAKGILTARGGLASHAAVIARGWGKPAVVGAEAVRILGRSFSVDGRVISEGDWLSLDGATGEVVLGRLELAQAEQPPELETILGWADGIRAGGLGVRANADTGPDAEVARAFGAEGIGLCRTEHMFLGPERLPIVRRAILAERDEDEAAALQELREVQREDFYAILKAMDGLPVTVRLLDPPLHEFLPSVLDLSVKQAGVGLDADEQRLLAAAQHWMEDNPMMGVRGVRLGVLKPGLYQMQVRALMEAAARRRAEGGRPLIEVMIPLTVSRAELALARSWVTETIAGIEGAPADVHIGTMVETPRAALVAGQLAEVADFFSIGSNDLTQMTFGFSRDDVEARIMPAYLERGLLDHDPFQTIDVEGVGVLVARAIELGRAARPGLKVGVCGEHGGDDASIMFFASIGVDYVSCSPYRVPVARLAAAHAALAAR